MKLRDYQSRAVSAIWNHLRVRDDNPVVEIPTGGGKTAVIAQLCRDAVEEWGGRVIILAHVKELLEQSAQTLNLFCPEIKAGVYSAGLKRREKDGSVIVAGIQSVYKRAKEMGKFDLVIVDEAHLIPIEGEGMYRTFLKAMKKINPRVRVVGLTATPYRMKEGLIVGKKNFLHHIAYTVGVRQLIKSNWLCPLISKAPEEDINTSGLHIRAGEFIQAEIEALMDTDDLVDSVGKEIALRTADRKAVLVFAAGVDHGHHVAEAIRKETGKTVHEIYGDTPSDERAKAIKEFRDGNLSYLVNCNVLTTGFDAPNVDAICLVRPTYSPGLYYQMVGRGFRKSPGKKECLVLDFGNNVIRHGPVDDIAIVATGEDEERGKGEPLAKKCPECCSLIQPKNKECPDCGFVFPPPEKKHRATASSASILSKGGYEEYEVSVGKTEYRVHVKKNAPPGHPKTLRVIYHLSMVESVSEFVCVEHEGFALGKAKKWWEKRVKDSPEGYPYPLPDTCEQAQQVAIYGGLRPAKSLVLRYYEDSKYPEIVEVKLGEFLGEEEVEKNIA